MQRICLDAKNTKNCNKFQCADMETSPGHTEKEKKQVEGWCIVCFRLR